MRRGKDRVESTWDGWIVDVDVYLFDESQNPPFELRTYLPKDDDGDIVFENHWRPGYLVRFNLKGPKASSYFFPDDPDDSLYSTRGSTGCPDASSKPYPQFRAAEVEAGNKTLLVKNLNQSGQGGKFRYTLRVLDQKGNERLIDPGGANMNGATGFNFS